MATGTDWRRAKADVERGCLIDLVALLPAVWTVANSTVPLLYLYLQWVGVALVLGPAALPVVLMLHFRRGVVRKDGGWDLILVGNVLALLYGLAMFYWWATRTGKDPL
jgi:hypothetical protein